MVPQSDVVAFFDIGNTLGSVAISPSGSSIELTAYPYVPQVLGELRDRGVALGIISDRGAIPPENVERALRTAGLWDFFAPQLVIYGRKDSPLIFERAAAQTATVGRLLFVGEDPGERAQALRAGYLVAPHPRLVWPVLDESGPLCYVRIKVPDNHADRNWSARLQDMPLLPLHVTGAGTTIYAIATPAVAARLDDLGFWVDRLGAEDAPLTSDLYLMRDDRQVASGFLAFDGNSTPFLENASRGVLASTEDGLVVAVPAGISVESYHFSGALHGHNLKLAPSSGFLTQNVDPAAFLAGERIADVTVGAAEREILNRVQPAQLAGHVERYAGVQPAGGNGRVIRSRHIQHADNAEAVTALVADLQKVENGRLAVRRHRFTHEGRTLDNVEAELPGSGLDGVVLVTAHLDSTGARQAGYRPAMDPAPGADDDASGIAAVLAAANVIAALDAALGVARRTVRFVLFNAEEHGLVGSRAYARDQSVLAVPIVAVFQLDMIGDDLLPDNSFELHTGFTPSPRVQAMSLGLAQLISHVAPQVSPALPVPQVYPAPGEPDPAEQRSDHSSFHAEGYAACLVSENLFAGPGIGDSPAEMNPNYHLPADAMINAGYAADIARAVTAAVWVAATR